MLFIIHNLPVHFVYSNIKSFIKKETKIPTCSYELGDLHIVYNKERRDHTKMVSVYTSNESVGELIMETLDGMYLDQLKLVVTTQPSQEECESSNSTRLQTPGAFNKDSNLSQQNVWSIKSTRERSRSTDSRQRDSPKCISDAYRSSEDRYRSSNSPSVSVSSWKTNRDSRRDSFTRNESDDSFKRTSRSPNRRESGRRHDSTFQKEVEHSDNIKQFGNVAFLRDQSYSEASNYSSYSEKDNLVAPPSRWDQKEWPHISQSNVKSDNSASDMLFVEKFVQAHANVIASQSTGLTEAQKVDILKASKTLEPFSPFIYYYTSDIYKKIFERIISFGSIYGKHVTDCSGEKINKTKIVDVHKKPSEDLDEPPEKKSVSEAYYNKDKETSEAVVVPNYYYVNQVMVDPITGSQRICQIPVANSSQNQDSGLFYYAHNQTMPAESLISHDGFYTMMTNNAMMQQATLPYYYGADQMVLANQDVNVSNDQSEDFESDDEFPENYSPIEKDIEARTDAANYLTSELVNKFRINDLPEWKKNEMGLKIHANIRKEFDRMFGENCQTNSHDIIANYEFRHDIHDNAELINAIHLTTLHPETQAGSSNKNKKLVRELTPLEKKAVDEEIESLISVARNEFMVPFNEVEKAMGEAAVDRGILEYLKEAIKENVVARIMGLNFKLQVKLDFEKKQKPKGLYLNEFLNNFGLVSLKHVSHSCVAEINYFRHLDKLCSINATKIGGVNTVIRPVLYGGSPIKLSRKIAVMHRKSFFKGPLLKKYNISRNDETETTKSKKAETATKSDKACSDTSIKVKHKTANSTAEPIICDDDDDDVKIIENIEIVDLYSGDEMGVKDMEIVDSDQELEISSEGTSDQTIAYGGQGMANVENEKESQFGDQITNVEGEKAVIDTANVTSICQESDIGANGCQNNENRNSIMEQPVEVQLSDNVATVENGNVENPNIAEIENSGQLFDSAVTNNTSQTTVNVESTNSADHENDLRCEFNHNTDFIDGDNDNEGENDDVTTICGDNENNGHQEIPNKCDFINTTDHLNSEKLEDNNTFTYRVIENENRQNNETARPINLSNFNANSASTKDSDPINTGNSTVGDNSEVTKNSDDTSVIECQDDKWQDVGKNDRCQDTENEVIRQGPAVKNDVKCQDTKSVVCEDIQKDGENPNIECQNESLCSKADKVSSEDENVEDCDIYAQDSENLSLENDQYVRESDEEVSLMETILSSNRGDDDEAEDLDELDPNYVEEWGDMWTNTEDDTLEDY